MKPLKKLDNIDRAKMLFQLFPEEMPSLIEYAKEQCKSIIDNEASIRDTWQPNALFTFDFWRFYVDDLLQRIERYENKLSKNCRLFTDQLFDGYTAMPMCHCVLEHAEKRKSENPNYALAVTLFFSHKY